jgi:hypothetical protein
MATNYPGSKETWPTYTDLVDFWVAADLNAVADTLEALQDYQAMGRRVRQMFGDGSDGAFDFDGVNTFTALATYGRVVATLSGSTYTLQDDIFATNITVRTGIVINANGYKIFATGTVSLEGTAVIHNDGGDGGAGLEFVGGAAGTAAGLGSTAEAILPAYAGEDNIIDPAGNPAGSPTVYIWAYGRSGGELTSGAGGEGFGPVQPAGASITVWGYNNRKVGLTSVNPIPYQASAQFLWHHVNPGNALVAQGAAIPSTGGPGGAMGMGPEACGGGGGGGGGVVLIAADTVTLAASAVISANGGAGGAGESGENFDNGGGGGGGGGTGGLVLIICRVDNTASGTVSATAGAGGAGGAGGPSVEATDGEAGSAGLPGVVKIFTPFTP